MRSPIKSRDREAKTRGLCTACAYMQSTLCCCLVLGHIRALSIQERSRRLVVRVYKCTGCPTTDAASCKLELRTSLRVEKSNTVFWSDSLLMSYSSLKFTKPRTLIARTIETVEDRAKMHGTNFVEHENPHKKVPNHALLSLEVQSQYRIEKKLKISRYN